LVAWVITAVANRTLGRSILDKGSTHFSRRFLSRDN
jgi:hypothetical protein